MESAPATTGHVSESINVVTPYDRWMESIGIPIHRGYFIDDLRTVELGWWEERGCNSCFLQLSGQENIQEARVTEIPPGETLPPLKLAVEEMVYVVQGHGLASVWADGMPKKSFEWQPHSLFMVPPNYTYQVSNARGDQPARLLQVNYLPLAMLLIPLPDFFLKNEFVDLSILYGEEQDAYSEAKLVVRSHGGERGIRNLWIGNFFPDMKAWDRLEAHRRRGAGGRTVDFMSRTGRGGHMSVFPVGTYKIAHRHGPGTVIVIPEGEGYSVLWQEGHEKIMVPWHEGSVFVPPNQWYHQHFNLGAVPARYLAISRPRPVFDTDESLDERQIPYVDEDPWIRETFERELAKRGLKSRMPPEVYTDPNYQWSYTEDAERPR